MSIADPQINPVSRSVHRRLAEQTRHLLGIPSRTRLQQQLFESPEMLVDCLRGAHLRSNVRVLPRHMHGLAS